MINNIELKRQAIEKYLKGDTSEIHNIKQAEKDAMEEIRSIYSKHHEPYNASEDEISFDSHNPFSREEINRLNQLHADLGIEDLIILFE